MICKQCESVGKKLEENFTKLERLNLLSGQMVMLRSCKAGRNDQNDLKIINSTITKLLLSFDIGSRETLRKYFIEGVGLNVELKSCAHDIGLVFS